MLLWLDDNTECKVPPFATHHCGVGGVVINNNNEILLVKEKSKNSTWKLPGISFYYYVVINTNITII
jgi:hypothetical protein